MSEPIGVGDLVMVVRDRVCCHNPAAQYGLTFRVLRFRNTGCYPCEDCGDMTPLTNAVGEGIFAGYDVRRLKRIPPLGELEGQPTHEDMKEPA